MTLSPSERALSLPGLQWLGRDVAAGCYRLRKVLSQEPQIVTFLAWDNRARAEVVLKMAGAAWLDSPEQVRRAAQEAHALTSLDHPRLARVLDAGREGEVPFVVVQRVPGGNLAERLQDADGNGTPQPPTGLKTWLEPVADALDYLHASKFVHRDVRPASVLFDAVGNAVLADMALVRALTLVSPLPAVDDPLPPDLVGVPEYLAPEVLEEQPSDGRADQFSLAVTAYEALTGHGPFEGLSLPAVVAAQHSQRVTPTHQALGSLPASLWPPLQRALSPDPARRYESCTAFARALLQAIDSAPRSVAPAAARAAVKNDGDRLRLACPSCKRTLRIPLTVRGKVIACPGCKASVRVSADGSNLQPAQSSGTAVKAREPVPCPACQQPLLLTPEQAGTQVYCAACQKLLDVTRDLRLTVAKLPAPATAPNTGELEAIPLDEPPPKRRGWFGR